jgi:hypothetical protein
MDLLPSQLIIVARAGKKELLHASRGLASLGSLELHHSISRL